MPGASGGREDIVGAQWRVVGKGMLAEGKGRYGGNGSLEKGKRARKEENDGRKAAVRNGMSAC